MTESEKNGLFEDMLNCCLPAMRATALRITGNTADADDAVQQALLRAWKKFSGFRHGSKLSSWVMRIVINESCNITRARRCAPCDYSPDILDSVFAEPESSEAVIAEIAIEKLPEVYRYTLETAVLSGLDGKTAAALAGCSENTLYQRVRRARNALRHILENMKNEE